MVSLILSEEVDTTWAFIRMIEHWNENEWWRPFKTKIKNNYHHNNANKYMTVSGEVSTRGGLRNCTHLVFDNLKDGRPRWKGSLKFVYCVMLETFIPKPQPGLVVDHKDHNVKNNSIHNLRWVTLSQNQLNKSQMFDKNGKLRSGVGVYVVQRKKGTRYHPRISVAGQKVGLGTYDTMKEADDVYRKAWKDYWFLMS